MHHTEGKSNHMQVATEQHSTEPATRQIIG